MEGRAMLAERAVGRFLAVGALALAALAGEVVADRVYRWTDPSGAVHFSDHPPPGGRPSEPMDLGLPPSAPPEAGQDDYYSVVNQARRLEEQRLERERQAAEVEALRRQAEPAPAPPREESSGAERGPVWIGPPYYSGPGGWPPHRPKPPGWHPPPQGPWPPGLRPEPPPPSFGLDTRGR
jgi:hypothetical protein